MTEPSDLAISTFRLRKIFGQKVAVRNLTLDVSRGEIFGFLGPNGAGKSTSIKMLLGLITPTSGRAAVLGRPAGDISTRAKIGFLPEHFRFYDWLTSAELLLLHGRLFGISSAELRRRVPNLLDLVGLTAHRDKHLRDFSKGMLQRIGLAQALINNPDLIFLDEPTSGLDPFGRRLVRDIIKSQRERGATVLLNSHLLSEIEITCDRVAFIKDGEVIETQELNSFRDEQPTVTIRAAKISAEALAAIHPLARSIRREGERITLSLTSNEAIPEVVRRLIENRAEVFEVATERLSLEQRFLKIVGTDGGL